MADSRTVIYVAVTSDAAASGAVALEAAGDGLDVEPATPDDVDYAAGMADCIVFAETPTTADGAALLDVIDDADDTPVVLFTEDSFEPAVARATDGIAGYVRRDASDATTHLADEIAWVCSGSSAPEADRSTASAPRHRRAAEHLASDYASLAKTLADRTGERDRLDDARTHLHDRLERTADQRDRFRAAFDATPEPACAYAVESTGSAIVTAVNDTFRATFGIGSGAAVDRPVTDVFDAAGIDVDGDRFRSALDPRRSDRDVVASGRNAGGPGVDREPPGDRGGGASIDGSVPDGVVAPGRRREVMLSGRYETDEGIRTYDVTVVPSGSDTDDSGPAVGLVVCADVTERRRAERELASRTHRLETIGDVLDDVRDPLSVARGYLEVAEETGDPEHFAEIDAAHEELREAVDHLGRLVGRDAVVVSREAVDLHDLARRAWADVETTDASLDLGPGARLEADSDQLRDAFERLFAAATARTGTDESGGQSVDVDHEPNPDDAIVVSVGATDDGFYVASSAADGNPFAGQVGARDGTDPRRDAERVAAAHGWRVGVAESREGTAIAFRGVDVERES
ncbi:phytochrome sensor protein [Halovivax cerinus]|uniref:histidine kinase n=1 Tax=Halovivax cerinus TaxID=1487865 RepID=A0ABD5NRW2_9EURY|nr:phytochrome sensor protein [Halovivax cerinus]